ncbi:sigma-B regulation protein RsbU (phosphoserine phosphatase) [Hypnocyclicus thermotrophus]|uniref:Sigma-B regulation protein RsbU (Phosphoserine phosphatase) n=1 Tax=Hypnocyclicus thermotrophus TaxID=1627895 RepID=A0AA46I581_9FUSO|nr:SpoIIE family protein phosphatase [Hypnocyclicus thermotrophus]TDT68589.1 sigma-B regulation protein RsbU (phosphoserine phosphatase) [Hypnocyclicus thermotrophus]
MILLMYLLLNIGVIMFFKQKYQKEKIKSNEELIKNIIQRNKDYKTDDEIQDEYIELINDIENQEKALKISLDEINSYKKELNITYKSLLAKSTELEYSNLVLEKRVANLSNLNAIGKSVLSELELDKIISIILDAYFVLTGAKKIVLYLWEEGVLVNKAIKGNVKAKKKYEFIKEELDPNLIYENISKDIVDINEDIIYSNLNVKGKELGVIYIIEDSENKRKSDDRETISALAMHVAIAINNSKVYSELAIKERLNKELNIAAKIQKDLLPKKSGVKFDIDISEYFEPAKEIGGDYYDYNIYSDDEIYITIGDVSGKGVPAALLMTTIRAILKTLSFTINAPNIMLDMLNKLMYKDMSSDMFVTIFHSKYNKKTNILEFSNAGHNPLLVYRNKENNIMEENVKGIAIGFLENYNYKEGKLKLFKNDILVYYTDGITEAENENGELFGIDRLKEIILKNSYKSSIEIKNEILNGVRKYRGNKLQTDDITLLVLKV